MSSKSISAPTMSSSKDIAARSCSRSSTGRLWKTSSITSCGRSGASSAISSASSVSVAATSSSVSIDEISDSRTASETSSRMSPSRAARDEVPDVEPLVERQRLEDVGDVGRVQPVELALQRRLALLVDGALGELGVRRRRRLLALLVDQPFDQPVLAQQRRDVGERVLHARAARRSARRRRVSTGSGMVRRAFKASGPEARRRRDGRAHSSPAARRLDARHARVREPRADGIRARIVATRPSR